MENEVKTAKKHEHNIKKYTSTNEKNKWKRNWKNEKKENEQKMKTNEKNDKKHENMKKKMIKKNEWKKWKKWKNKMITKMIKKMKIF
jgi:hypothetical protein